MGCPFCVAGMAVSHPFGDEAAEKMGHGTMVS
jgi:hypothetical protein